jgi:hypothetical protein
MMKGGGDGEYHAQSWVVDGDTVDAGRSGFDMRINTFAFVWANARYRPFAAEGGEGLWSSGSAQRP